MLKDKVKVLMVAHITAELDLSKKEAEEFWPIYNTYTENIDKTKDKNLRKLYAKFWQDEKLTESEAEKIIQETLKTEKKRFELKEKLVKDLKQILPNKKIALLFKAQETFKRKLFRKYRDYHSKMHKQKNSLP
ncbi:MAG: hypothetical protein OIF50_04085 [Flavobacteriaceae bacterium]|nr:hypothetical protein [Flavobacteriaceae bacterium]